VGNEGQKTDRVEWTPPDPALRTADIALRPFVVDDADAVAAACADDAIVRFTFMEEGLTADGARRWIERGNEWWSHGHPRFAIVARTAGSLLGQVGIAADDRQRSAEAYYWVSAKARGRGVATNALGLVADWAFDNGIERLCLLIHPDNRASMRLGARMGFRREGVLRAYEPFKGGRPDLTSWSLLPDDDRRWHHDARDGAGQPDWKPSTTRIVEAAAASGEEIHPELRPGDERVALEQRLDQYRRVVVSKLADLEDEQASRRALRATDLTVGGVLKHLAWTEDYWFQNKLLGLDLPEPWASAPLSDDPDWPFRSSTGDSVQVLRMLYSNAVGRSREAAGRFESLDALAVAPSFSDGPVNLRWIMVHMIDETARHAGHLDLLRDEIDR